MLLVELLLPTGCSFCAFICSVSLSLIAHPSVARNTRGANLTRPRQRHLEAPTEEARKAAPGWARAFGGLPLRSISRFSDETGSRSYANGLLLRFALYAIWRMVAVGPARSSDTPHWASGTDRSPPVLNTKRLTPPHPALLGAAPPVFRQNSKRPRKRGHHPYGPSFKHNGRAWSMLNLSNHGRDSRRREGGACSPSAPQEASRTSTFRAFSDARGALGQRALTPGPPPDLFG